MVVKHYKVNPLAGTGMILWGDLHVLFESTPGGSSVKVWNDQQEWVIHNWKLFPFSGVHVLETFIGKILYMFADTPYPHSASLMKKMQKHKLEVEIDGIGNDMTYAVQLIKFIKNQLASSAFGWFLRSLSRYGLQSTSGVTLSGTQGFVQAISKRRPNRLASPRGLSGYLVKASSNPFTFYDSPLPGVNTPWDVMRIVCNPELIDVAEVVQIPTGRYVVPTGRVIDIVSIKVPTGRRDFQSLTGNQNSIILADMEQSASTTGSFDLMKRFESTTLEGVDLVLWGDLRIMFNANTEDELWQN
ncbi:hypothetical protein Tco_0655133 [Tanacetum coccineum]|uniref:Uncharacterized protein n=1 Tax=Tanacetum coccineum TaxID=301880 RepID=A0ABQ4X552_9ASTR